jgi:hypothetical protein
MAFPRSGTVDTQTFSGTKDFIFGHVNAVQNANIGNGDHLKFDTVDFQRPLIVSPTTGAAGGSAESLDTSTTYTNALGVASIGRFSVRGGKVYKLECSPGYVLFSGATGLLTLQWVDVTVVGAQVALGQPLMIEPVTQTTNDIATGDLWTFYAPGGGQNDVFLLEVQIIGAPTALTSIGSATKGQPSALVETY